MGPRVGPLVRFVPFSRSSPLTVRSVRDQPEGPEGVIREVPRCCVESVRLGLLK